MKADQSVRLHVEGDWTGNRRSRHSMITLHNIDCMEHMKSMKDNEFDLAICDPPYGIGCCVSSKSVHLHKPMVWNNEPPKREYFHELYRVSKNRIIWGANYYWEHITERGAIIHDKLNGGQHKASHSLSEADIASQSFNNLIKIYRYAWKGNVQGDGINWDNIGIDARIHPTQKPVKLYEWLLKNYAKEGDKILDTHLGSGSIAIACYNMGYSLTGYEIDKDYYEAAVNRLEEHKRQGRLFKPVGQGVE